MNYFVANLAQGQPDHLDICIGLANGFWSIEKGFAGGFFDLQ